MKLVFGGHFCRHHWIHIFCRVLTIIHVHVDYLFIKWNKTPKQPISIISTADPANVSGRITDIMRCLGRSIISSVSLVVNTSSIVLSYCHSISVMLISYCPTTNTNRFRNGTYWSEWTKLAPSCMIVIAVDVTLANVKVRSWLLTLYSDLLSKRLWKIRLKTQNFVWWFFKICPKLYSKHHKSIMPNKWCRWVWRVFQLLCGKARERLVAMITTNRVDLRPYNFHSFRVGLRRLFPSNIHLLYTC